MIPTIPQHASRLWMLLLLSAIGANAFLWQQPILGTILFVLWLHASAKGWGFFLLPQESPEAQWIAGTSGSIATFGLLGSLVYYTGAVRTLSVFACLAIVSSAAALFEHKKYRQRDLREFDTESSPTFPLPLLKRFLHLGLLFGAGLALISWWQAILPIQVTDSIRSPWLAVPPTILIAIAFAGTILYALASFERKWTPWLLAATLFSAVAIAYIIYPLGFGFDPFLHQATVQHIIDFGSITPKPLYYIGAYALEFGGSLLFGWPLIPLDHLLLPLIGSVCLTSAAWIGLTRALKQPTTPAALVVFFFPLFALTTTTPQSLAYVLVGSLLFFSFPFLQQTEKKPPYPFFFLLALYTLSIHPIAGIPAILYASLLFAQTITRPILRRAITGILWALFLFAIPGLFLFQAQQGNLPIHFNPSGFIGTDLHLSFFLQNHFHPFFDGLYLVIQNSWWLVALLALIGFLLSKNETESKPFLRAIPLLAGVACFASFLFMHTLSFDFLIEYERADYADRLLTLSTIFFLPHAGYALGIIDQFLREKKQVGMRAAWAGILGCVIAAQVYGAYPRHDNYSRSAGFNVGQDELSAVDAIKTRAGETPYIVLSDQSLSAAAVYKDGFAHYFHETIFYYPIPTGGPLYQYYLDMTEEPTKDTMNAAMELAGVQTSFFAVNTYWWDSQRIIEHAKQKADDWFAIGDVTIFVFTK